MAGHSKWANIKRRKGAQDAKRAKQFTRIIKEIHVAVREGGGDPESNPRLRLAMQNAKGVNMPKDNIQRAIAKAEGDDANSYQEVTFEGYGPNGIAIFIECLTDNNQRTVSMVRSVFNKRGGSLGTNGSLSFLFERKGIFTVPKKDDLNREEFELELIDAGLEDIDENDETYILTVPMEEFGNMNKTLEDMGVEVENAELQRIPNNTSSLSVEDSKKILQMIEDFEEIDDVQNVYHNLEMTEELAEALE